jgi:tape measure domain-containing protein
MATDLERLVVSFEANAKKFTSEVARMRTVTDKALGDIERRAAASQKRVTASFGGMGSRLASGLAGGLSGRLAGPLAAVFGAAGIAQAAAQYTGLQNQLKVTGLEGENLRQVFESLGQIAVRNGAPIDSLVQLYSRMSLSAKDLGASQSDMLSLTSSVALALRVQGTTAQEASGALLQLAQALGGGTVQAEEYNSLLDGMPALLRATAAGITEAGGSVSKLTQLVKSGKVSSEAFFRGTLAGTQTLAQQAEKTTGTVGQSWQNLRTAVINVVGEFDKATLASAVTSHAIDGIAVSISKIPGAIADAKGSVAEFAEQLRILGSRLPIISDLQKISHDNKVQGALGAELGALAKENTRKLAPGEIYGPVQPPAAPPKPVSINDFPVAAKTKSGSGSGTSRKSPDERFDRSLDGTREQIAQLEAERTGLSQTTEAREKAAETVKLYADAKRAGLAVDKEGIPVDATVRQRVDELSSAYGRAAQALDDARQKQQQFGELQQFIGDNLSSFFSDIVTGSATVEDSLKRIVSALGDAALQAALLGQGPLAGLFGTSGTGGKTGGLIGALSGLFGGSSGGGASIAGGSGGLYAFGGYTGPGGKYQPAGVVHKGEYVFDAAATRRLGIGNLEALRRGYANGGSVGAMGVPKMPAIPSAAARQGGGGVNVVVNNHSDSQVTTRESTGPGGTKQLEVMVEQVIQKSLSRNGPVARQLQGTYGLNRMGRR